MIDHTKKHEAAHVPPAPMKDSEGNVLAEASKTHSNAAAADKSKRESGKDKEQHKR
jgi:hypothetical protein